MSVFSTFRIYGLSIDPSARDYLDQIIRENQITDSQPFLAHVIQECLKHSKSSVVTLNNVENAVSGLLTKSDSHTESVLVVLSYPQVPKLSWDSRRKEFSLEVVKQIQKNQEEEEEESEITDELAPSSTTTLSSIPKTKLYSFGNDTKFDQQASFHRRYQLFYQRTLNQPKFSSQVLKSKFSANTAINLENRVLVSVESAQTLEDPIWIIGRIEFVINKRSKGPIPTGYYILRDPTGTIELDFSQLQRKGPGFITNTHFVIIEAQKIPNTNNQSQRLFTEEEFKNKTKTPSHTNNNTENSYSKFNSKKKTAGLRYLFEQEKNALQKQVQAFGSNQTIENDEYTSMLSKFHVFQIAAPPIESKTGSSKYIGHLDTFGGNSKKFYPQNYEFMSFDDPKISQQDLEFDTLVADTGNTTGTDQNQLALKQRNALWQKLYSFDFRQRLHLLSHCISTRNQQNFGILIINSLNLDSPYIISKFVQLLNKFSAPPPCILLLGNFSSMSLKFDFVQFSKLLIEFAQLIPEKFKTIETRWIFVPGPDDPGISLFPQPPFSETFAQHLNKAFKNVEITSNPCRAVFCGLQLTVCRFDLLQALTANYIIPPSPPDISTFVDHMIVTLCSQSHLIPLPPYIAPRQWKYDHSMSLYPLPDVCIYSDNSCPQFSKIHSDCLFINPGSFTQNGDFALYYPNEHTSQFGQVPI